MKYWTIEPDEWRGADVFIICGGTSVTQQQVDLLYDRHVVTINSSYQKAPWAEMLFFADRRWWERENMERPKLLDMVTGTIVTTSRQAKETERHKLVRLRRQANTPPGIAVQPDTVVVSRTSLQGVLNICYHKRVGRCILLGADNGPGETGRIHHHDEYPWPTTSTSWTDKITELSSCVDTLRTVGIQVVNCSPASTLPWWPKIPLEQVLA